MTVTVPSGARASAQCMRETSGSFSGMSAPADLPILASPPRSRWTPPASGPETTSSVAGTGSRPGPSSGRWKARTAPSTSGGLPRSASRGSSRWSSQNTDPGAAEPGVTVAAIEPRTAESGVSAGAAISTSTPVVASPCPRTVNLMCSGIGPPVHLAGPAATVPTARVVASDADAESILAPATDSSLRHGRSMILIGHI